MYDIYAKWSITFRMRSSIHEEVEHEHTETACTAKNAPII